jgi:hypothetical protein
VSEWDLVLRGGRVIAPETGLDAVRDVAFAEGRIAAVGARLAAGRAEVDVARQLVTAGFIDLHSHVSDMGGMRLQAMDGVTTALELEAGATPVADANRRAAAQGRPVNYGFAASWALARMEAVAGLPPDASLGAFMIRISDPALQRPAEPAQVSALLVRLSADLADGALGPVTGAAPSRRRASGKCWSAAPSWCATVAWCPTPGPGGRFAPTHANPLGRRTAADGRHHVTGADAGTDAGTAFERS